MVKYWRVLWLSMPRTQTLFDYEAEKDETHEEKTSTSGGALYRRPWNTCTPETPAEHFYQSVVEVLREDDVANAMFEYALYVGDTDDPTGLLIQHRSAETSDFLRSEMPGVKRALEAAGYTVVYKTDKRYRNDQKPTQVIVTGHACTGGDLPEQVARDIESTGTVEKQAVML
jgi:hypothetical protein